MTKISGVAEVTTNNFSNEFVGFDLDKEELEQQMASIVHKYKNLDVYAVQIKYKGEFKLIDEIYKDLIPRVYLWFYPEFPNSMFLSIRLDGIEAEKAVTLDPNTNKLANMEDFEYEEKNL